MSASAWDAELSAAQAEITALRAAHGRTRPTGANGLTLRQVEVLQLKLRLDRQLERLHATAQRDLLLLPREKAMLHWARVYLQRTREFMELRSRVLTRSLWLKLVKTRLGAGDAVQDPLAGDDAVSLAVRHQNLAQAEAYLARELARLKDERDGLVVRYQQRDVAGANRTAARSFQVRLGATLADALANPTVTALARYLVAVAAPRSQPEAVQRRQALECRLEARTSGLMALCRKVAAARTLDPAARVSPRVLGRFEAAMAQLDDLAAEAQLAHEQILRTGGGGAALAAAAGAAASPPPDGPIPVQNTPGHARTVPTNSVDQPGAPGL